MIQELFSPIVTPFLLCFNLRYKSLDIVDFFRNFTVDVVGVGDVCSFAQMDVKRHGNPEVSLQIKNKNLLPFKVAKPHYRLKLGEERIHFLLPKLQLSMFLSALPIAFFCCCSG